MSYGLNLAKGLGMGKLVPSDSIPVSFGYRLGIERGAIWVYNYKMPWYGGTYSLSGGNNMSKPAIRYWHLGDYDLGYETDYDEENKPVGRENDCDLPGIYFRQFWTRGHDPAYATLSVSLWYPVLFFAVLPLLWILRQSYTWKESILLPIVQAPWVIQLYRCLFVAIILYFDSYLRNFPYGGWLSGLLIFETFTVCGIAGLILTFVRVSWSRWVIASLGILIPATILGALFLWLPYQGWFDALCGLFIWSSVVFFFVAWALALFKDEKTKVYFVGTSHAGET
jgi:hypothetical protein